MSARHPWAMLGEGFRIRPATQADHPALAGLIRQMDKSGLYERHFAHGDAPNQALLQRIAEADGRDRVVLLGVGADGTAIAHAEYVSVATVAEFALMVLPAWRGRGIGQALLAALLEIAVRSGQSRLHGLIQAGNTAAIRVARGQGFTVGIGDERTTVIVSRHIAQERAADPTVPQTGASITIPIPVRHDPDRTALHRCPGP